MKAFKQEIKPLKDRPDTDLKLVRKHQNETVKGERDERGKSDRSPEKREKH